MLRAQDRQAPCPLDNMMLVRLSMGKGMAIMKVITWWVGLRRKVLGALTAFNEGTWCWSQESGKFSLKQWPKGFLQSNVLSKEHSRQRKQQSKGAWKVGGGRVPLVTEGRKLARYLRGEMGKRWAGEKIRSRPCRSCRFIDFYLRLMESSHSALFNSLSKQE